MFVECYAVKTRMHLVLTEVAKFGGKQTRLGNEGCQWAWIAPVSFPGSTPRTRKGEFGQKSSGAGGGGGGGGALLTKRCRTSNKKVLHQAWLLSFLYIYKKDYTSCLISEIMPRFN